MFDASGVLLVVAGTPRHQAFAEFAQAALKPVDSKTGLETLIKEITFRKVPLEDLFAQAADGEASGPTLLGHAVVELSRDGLLKRQQEMLQLRTFQCAFSIELVQ